MASTGSEVFNSAGQAFSNTMSSIDRMGQGPETVAAALAQLAPAKHNPTGAHEFLTRHTPGWPLPGYYQPHEDFQTTDMLRSKPPGFGLVPGESQVVNHI